MVRRPLLSIGMPVYNAEQFLEDGLKSILNQTFTDFEVILSDNASTDRTPQICRDYEASDPRIRFYRSETNKGAGWNHNRVLEFAASPYFKWQSHDDVCELSMIEKCVAALERNQQAVLAHPGTTFIDGQGIRIGNYAVELRTDSPDVALRFNDLVASYHECYQIYGVIRRSALDRTGSMGNFVGGDAVLLGNLALYGPFEKIPEELFFSRRHQGQSSQTVPSRLRERRLRLTKKTNGLPATEWWDTSKRRALTFPQWRQSCEYIRSVNRAPLSFRDRARCHGVTVRWMIGDRRRYVKDVVIAADQMVYNMFAHKKAGLSGAKGTSRITEAVG